VVRELISHRLVGLAVGDLMEGHPINPGQDPPVADDVTDKLGERVVPATDGHALPERGEIGVERIANVEIGPDPVDGLIEPALEVPRLKSPRTINGVSPCAAASIQPSRTGICASSVSQAELVEAFSKHSLLRCTDMS
jgi:hypothetical protein